MKNIFRKIKSKTVAVVAVTLISGYFAGKKFIKYVSEINGEMEPLTDEEIRNTLGIGAGDEYTVE